MKTTIILAVTAILFSVCILSCHKGPTITRGEENLLLQAPSGMPIANGIAALKAKVGKVVYDKHGSQPFEILTLEYFPVTKGYAAVIYYRLQNGLVSSYLSIGGIAYRTTDTGVQLLPNEPITNRESDEGGVQCVKTAQCTGECKMSCKFNEGTQSFEVDCGCGGKCDQKII
jgi:hypothetical protein